METAGGKIKEKFIDNTGRVVCKQSESMMMLDLKVFFVHVLKLCKNCVVLIF